MSETSIFVVRGLQCSNCGHYSDHRIADPATDRIAALKRDLAEARAYRDAIDAELVNMGMTVESYPDARSAVKAALDWVQAVALDPRVSSDAEALIQRGRDEARAEVERLKADAAELEAKLRNAERARSQP